MKDFSLIVAEFKDLNYWLGQNSQFCNPSDALNLNRDSDFLLEKTQNKDYKGLTVFYNLRKILEKLVKKKIYRQEGEYISADTLKNSIRNLHSAYKDSESKQLIILTHLASSRRKLEFT